MCLWRRKVFVCAKEMRAICLPMVRNEINILLAENVCGDDFFKLINTLAVSKIIDINAAHQQY